MSTSSAGSCAFCASELGRGPRYILDFRACAGCVRQHERAGASAPLGLPAAKHLERRMLPVGECCN